MTHIGFTGDFCPWLRIEERYQKQDWKSLFSEVHSFFQENDLNVLDLECPLTLSESKIKKTGPYIKAHPNTVEILNHLNCSLVATANNHFKDYGWEGMKETYDTLTKNGISWFGSGKNYKDASQTHYWKKEELTIAFINVAENEWSTTFDAEPGCHPIDLVNVYNEIQKAKQQADFIVVVAHGGHEHYELPSPRMKKWYRFFVDAGASAVMAHHTHIISGYEVYKDAPIFYSLGNFCFDWEGLRRMPWNKGMIVRLAFEKNQPVTFETEFVTQNEDALGIFKITGKEKIALEKHIEKLNSIIADDEQLEAAFQKFATTWKPVMNTWIQPYQGKILPGLHKRGLLPSLINTKKKLLLANLIRCEAHRDLLIKSLK